MSWWLYSLNVISSLILLASCGFLSFLWFGSDNNRTWQRFASRNWITQATTIASALIRFATGVQATTASCMLASVMSEIGGVPLRELANVSIMRTYSSPFTLWWAQLQIVISKRRPVKRGILPTLITLLVIPSIVLQFTSTLLVFDIRPGFVPR
jgi:hypothetical protein